MRVGCARSAPPSRLPGPGAFLWPQLPLAVPVGLLVAALNLAGRRQAIDPAEVKRTQHEAQRRMDSASSAPPPCATTTSAPSPWASRSTVISAGPARPGHGAPADADPVPADRRHSGTGKTTDIEREGFRAARDGRKFFLIDGKGTDPGFVERALAGLCGATPTPASRCGRSYRWTAGGDPAAIHNRLMALLGWTEPYYQDVALSCSGWP